MKQFVVTVSTIILFLFCINACKKEGSFETGSGTGGDAVGNISDSLGNCSQILVKGNYQVDSIFTDSNYLVIKLNITSRGKYKVTTDSSNGFWFIDSGYILNPGIQTVKVKGHGKPLLPLITPKVVTFDSTSCQININCGVFPLTTNNDYFPTTVGSNWAYYYSSNLSDTLNTSVSNLYGIIGLNAYSIFVSSYGGLNDTTFYRKDVSGNYYQYVSLLDTSSGPIDYPFLKDYKNVNDNWESDTVRGILNGQAVTVKYKFTMVAKNQSFTFNSLNYNDVIEIKEEAFIKSAFVSSFPSTSLSTDYSYYARNIGWVASQYPSSPTENITLKRKPNIK